MKELRIEELEKQSAPTEDELEALRIAAYEPTKNWSEKLQSLYEKLIHYEQGEQKSVKFKPLFKIGDVIKPKDPVLGEPRIIKGIHPKFGYDTNNGILDFEFEDNWELVEQKLADKVEPKFNEGDWAVSNLDGKARQISEVHFDEYNSYYVVDGKAVNLEEYDRLHHLWTIQDAKDGDVLFYRGNVKHSSGIKYERICLFNNLDNAFFTLTKTSNFVEEYGIDVNIDYPDNTVPATKEQKEILFMAMKDAGYAFDFEKKELKQIKQKSAWSKEDEQILNAAILHIKNETYNYYGGHSSEYIMRWLKSIKDKVQPQSKQEWSEEDERTYKSVLYAFKHNFPLYHEQQKFIKSLKERVQSQNEC